MIRLKNQRPVLEKRAGGPFLRTAYQFFAIDRNLTMIERRETGGRPPGAAGRRTLVGVEVAANTQCPQPCKQGFADRSKSSLQSPVKWRQGNRRGHRIRHFKVMQQCAAAGGPAHDIDGFSPASVDVQLRLILLRVTDGDRRLRPAIHPDGRLYQALSAFGHKRAVRFHIVPGGMKPVDDKPPLLLRHWINRFRFML